jgi:hypothetical protein
MLTMDIDESAPQFFEHTQRAETAIDIHPMTARSGKHTSKYQLRLVRTDDVVEPQALKEWMPVREMKGRFKLSLVFSGTDLVGRSASADQQGDGVDEERFTGAGLTGQDCKPGMKLKAQLLNEREIDNAQLGEHCGR